MAVKPNLPIERVKTVLMSGAVPEFCRGINELGINVVSTDKINNFLPFEAEHADMQFLPLDENTAAVLDNAVNIKNKLQKLYKTFYDFSLNKNTDYPNNVLLNNVIVGKYVIGNSKAIPANLMYLFNERNLEFIHVRQGYAKCSAAVINENALITSDESIYKACVSRKFDVLKISAGQIILPGTNYGFIGGCCGKLSEHELVFTGNIKLHSDYENIKSFCSNYNITFICLTNKPLVDIGGIIPIN